MEGKGYEYPRCRIRPGGGIGGFRGAPAFDDAFGGSGCFVAGTLIRTPDGPKPIETIQPGQLVYSFNVETRKIESKKVLGTMRAERADLAAVSVEGRIIVCSKNHRFYCSGEWKEAAQLSSGENELLAIRDAGSLVFEVPGSSVVFNASHPVRVYNFEVEGNHNYFVGEVGVLVHNNKRFNGDLSGR